MSQTFALPRPRPRSSIAGESGVLSGWIAAVETWLIRRQGWRDLNLLDDRLLDDVGLARKTVLWKAGMPFWRS